MAFEYRARSREQWEARANQSGDYDSWLKDEYRMYKPPSGENCVRILPPGSTWKDPAHYGIDVWVHYSVGPDKASVICLFRMKKGNCPICEDRARYERAKEEEKARELRPAKRMLVFILNQKDPGQGPLAWGMPKTVDESIAKVSKDRATGEYYFIDDHREGYDIYFEKSGEGLLTKYSGIALARRPTALPGSVIEWLEDHAVPEALHWRNYEEVRRLYVGAGRGEAEDETPTTANVTPLRPRRRDDDDDYDRPPPRRNREEYHEESRPSRNSAWVDDNRPTRFAPADDDDRPMPPRRSRDDDDEYSRARPERSEPPPRSERITRPEPEEPRQAMRRPSAKPVEDKDEPPFEVDESPASEGKTRAEQLKSKLSGLGKTET